MATVQFDTRGTTRECPKRGEAFSDECLGCEFCEGHDGFTVFCSYVETEFEVLARDVAREEAYVEA